jgi:hypothetical protein
MGKTNTEQQLVHAKRATFSFDAARRATAVSKNVHWDAFSKPEEVDQVILKKAWAPPRTIRRVHGPA